MISKKCGCCQTKYEFDNPEDVKLLDTYIGVQEFGSTDIKLYLFDCSCKSTLAVKSNNKNKG